VPGAVGGPQRRCPLQGCPKTRRRRREAQKLAFGSNSLRFSFRRHRRVFGSAECGPPTAPGTAALGLGAGLRYAKVLSRVLRKVIGLTWAGREWRGAAFGAAGRDAVKTEREAHMFEPQASLCASRFHGVSSGNPEGAASLRHRATPAPPKSARSPTTYLKAYPSKSAQNHYMRFSRATPPSS
jgi:hypothetical protein